MKGTALPLLLLGIVVWDTVSAQEDLLLTPPLNISGRVLTLESRVQDLKGAAQELKGATQELEVKETATEVKIELSGDILFDFDKWDIRPAAEPMLSRVAEMVKQYPQGGALIEGHTDAKGADAYNRDLSQKRADAVKAWLVSKGGVNGKRLAAKGWGEVKPAVPNTNSDGSDNPDNRQKNRRVEVTVRKQGRIVQN